MPPCCRGGAGLIIKALDGLDDLPPQAQPQDGVSYASKIDKAEAAVDWSLGAEEVSRRIRGLSPFPGAWTMLGGARVKLLGARIAPGEGAPGVALDDGFVIACGRGAVQVTLVQRAGKGAQETEVFLRGNPVPAGTKLGG